MTAAWLDDNTVVTGLTGSFERSGAYPTSSPGSVGVIDTRRWSARAIDRQAGDIALGPGKALLSFGAQRRGMRATALDGTTRWTVLRQRRLRSVIAAAGRVYALDEAGDRAHVLDAATGARISAPRLALGRLQILAGRGHSGDPHP